MSSRASKRNTMGGKAFKSQKKGDEGFRAKAAREAAYDLFELIVCRETKGVDGLSDLEKRALLELQVGRITRKFGNGRFEVYCQDGRLRNCVLRGLLRRKGQCYVEVDSIIAFTLSEPLDELDGECKNSAYYSKADQGYIVGIFDSNTGEKLRKTRINPTLFMVTDSCGNAVVDDLFDRSEVVVELDDL